MFVKNVGTVLTIVLALALLGGGAYFLMRPAEARSEVAHGWERGEETGAGRGQGQAGSAQGGQGYGGGRGGSEAGARIEQADHPEETWLTLTGAVVALDDELTIRTDEGEAVVHLGPEWYWEAEGIDLVPGDQVAVTGFYEGDVFEVGRIENLESGESVTLRDESGRPMWAGRGRAGR